MFLHIETIKVAHREVTVPGLITTRSEPQHNKSTFLNMSPFPSTKPPFTHSTKPVKGAQEQTIEPTSFPLTSRLLYLVDSLLKELNVFLFTFIPCKFLASCLHFSSSFCKPNIVRSGTGAWAASESLPHSVSKNTELR